MMSQANLRIRQVSLGQSNRVEELIDAEKASSEARSADWDSMQASLLSSAPAWPHSSNLQGCPYPMLVPEKLLHEFELIHSLLNSAITNIVERWWTDEEAGFSKIMPLEKHEEEILRWMESQDETTIPRFQKRQGSWRPDFLLEKNGNYRICEINSRFAFNGFLYTSFGQQAHIDMDDQSIPVSMPAVWPKQILTSLLSLFDSSLPLHLLKGEEAGYDIHLFISYVFSVTGRKPSLIKPSDLRLEPDALSPSGSALYCVAKCDVSGDEILQKIYQVGLELHQRELRALPIALLKEISTRCFNDFRTIFLVHDKRMLGIVLQELENLVEVQKVLSPSQAEVLRHSIARTIIPGSQEIVTLRKLSKDNPAIKNNYILKPIRSGKGAGIMFGGDMTPASWILELEHLETPDLTMERTRYVVQQKIEQSKYDILLHNIDGQQKNYLVGTYMSVHGRYVGIGIWRTSANRICAVSQGGAWICSVLSATLANESKCRKDGVNKVYAAQCTFRGLLR